jgi:hypothetical protein
LLKLRKRMARIRVFDPACGSGNFLVIAYKQMREIEAEINCRRGESYLGSEIPLTNFRGIELRDFPAEIARLALIIDEFQCDVLYRGQKDALAEFLPLNAENWIVCGNALRLDWLRICPPTGTGVKLVADDLFGTPLQQAEIEFANEGGETYICGNPPYLGSIWQTAEQKADLQAIFDHRCKNWKSLDYVAGWFMKAADYGTHTPTTAAFVSTNSICQGQQVPILWQLIFGAGSSISFAHTSFKWANLASHNAGVTVVIVGISRWMVAICYFRAMRSMRWGTPAQHARFIRRIYGSAEFIRGLQRYCLWIEDVHLQEALQIAAVRERIESVKKMRLASRDSGANAMAARAHQLREMNLRSVTVSIGVNNMPAHGITCADHVRQNIAPNPRIGGHVESEYTMNDIPVE